MYVILSITLSSQSYGLAFFPHFKCFFFESVPCIIPLILRCYGWLNILATLNVIFKNGSAWVKQVTKKIRGNGSKIISLKLNYTQTDEVEHWALVQSYQQSLFKVNYLQDIRYFDYTFSCPFKPFSIDTDCDQTSNVSHYSPYLQTETELAQL